MHLASYLGSCHVQINNYDPIILMDGIPYHGMLLLYGEDPVPQVIGSVSILATGSEFWALK